jgi:hypothetical protein
MHHQVCIILNIFLPFFSTPFSPFDSVRLKIVWFYWGRCYARATFWFIVRSKHGVDGTLYVHFSMKILLIT